MFRGSSQTGRLLAVAIVLSLWAVPSLPAAGIPSVSLEPLPAAAACEPLTRPQRIAQLVMAGIPGTTVDATARRVVTKQAGSVILFGRNISHRSQLLRLTRGLHRAAEPVRLLIAVDEEGGRVARLGSEGLVSRVPSAREVARTKTVGQTRGLGRRLGDQMARLGIDWNLAPVLDVTGAPAHTVIGDRSYSPKKGIVRSYGRAFAQGLRNGGVLASAKHFPGHGRTSVDSHHGLPTVKASLAGLRDRDLPPYVGAKGDLDAVMSAHVRFTALDRKWPASLSKAATDLLRDEIGFDGVLITDSLLMGAIAKRWPPPVAAELAIRRGADIVLFTDWTYLGKVMRRLKAALRQGRLPEARFEEAVERVLKLKGYGENRIACLLG